MYRTGVSWLKCSTGSIFKFIPGYIIYHDPMQKFYSWNSNQISLANAMEVERMNNSDRTQLGGSLLIKVILALVEDSGNITYCAASFKL